MADTKKRQAKKFVKVAIRKSKSKGKKYDAVFTRADGKTKTVSFGASGYSDYTMHKDQDRMKRYLIRHRSRENWTRSGAKTAGFWSRWLLWSEPDFRRALRKTERALGQKIIYK
jgi:hypothetical protein